jgi:hypothetical protein
MANQNLNGFLEGIWCNVRRMLVCNFALPWHIPMGSRHEDEKTFSKLRGIFKQLYSRTSDNEVDLSTRRPRYRDPSLSDALRLWKSRNASSEKKNLADGWLTSLKNLLSGEVQLLQDTSNRAFLFKISTKFKRKPWNECDATCFDPHRGLQHVHFHPGREDITTKEIPMKHPTMRLRIQQRGLKIPRCRMVTSLERLLVIGCETFL